MISAVAGSERQTVPEAPHRKGAECGDRPRSLALAGDAAADDALLLRPGRRAGTSAPSAGGAGAPRPPRRRGPPRPALARAGPRRRLRHRRGRAVPRPRVSPGACPGRRHLRGDDPRRRSPRSASTRRAGSPSRSATRRTCPTPTSPSTSSPSSTCRRSSPSSPGSCGPAATSSSPRAGASDTPFYTPREAARVEVPPVRHRAGRDRARPARARSTSAA